MRVVIEHMMEEQIYIGFLKEKKNYQCGNKIYGL